jgi:hypothetical protein
VRGGPFHKLRTAIGLVPEGGLGLARRAVALVTVAWLPVVAGALIAGQALNGQGTDPLLRHFGIHSRLLLAIPLLIFAEAITEKLIPPVIRHFVTSGIVHEAALPSFQQALDAASRLRDSIWGRVFVLTAIAAVILTASANKAHIDEMAWAITHADGGVGIGFAGWWFIFVSRPIFAGLLAIWLWRILVMWTLVWKISQLDLRLVASHPDGVGGLAFVEGTTVAMAPVVLAISVVIAGRWGHDVLYHGVHVESLKPLVAFFVVTVVLFFNGPLLLLGRSLRAF